MMNALIKGYEKSVADINTKVDNIYNNLNGKIEALDSHVKILVNQFKQAASRMKVPSGTLPRKSIINSREHVNAVSFQEEESDSSLCTERSGIDWYREVPRTD